MKKTTVIVLIALNILTGSCLLFVNQRRSLWKSEAMRYSRALLPKTTRDDPNLPNRPVSRHQIDPSTVPPAKDLSEDPSEGWRTGERYKTITDLNNDGIQDLLLSFDTGLFGNGGGWFDVYLGEKDGSYSEIGEIFGDTAMAKEVTQDAVRIWTYSHISSQSGTLGYYEIKDKNVSDIRSIVLYGEESTDMPSNDMFSAVFDEARTLKPLRSETVNGKVSWVGL